MPKRKPDRSGDHVAPKHSPPPTCILHVLEKAEVTKGEAAVQRVLTATRIFTNPFKIVDKERVYSLASGAPVPSSYSIKTKVT